MCKSCNMFQAKVDDTLREIEGADIYIYDIMEFFNAKVFKTYRPAKSFSLLGCVNKGLN